MSMRTGLVGYSASMTPALQEGYLCMNRLHADPVYYFLRALFTSCLPTLRTLATVGWYKEKARQEQAARAKEPEAAVLAGIERGKPFLRGWAV
jgi:hypothetical protein